MMPLAKSQRYSKTAYPVHFDLASDANIALKRRAKFPVHLETVTKVLPAIAGSHIPTARTVESAIGRQCHRCVVFPRHRYALAGNLGDAGIISHASAFNMRREQYIDLQAVQQILLTLDRDLRQNHRIMRIVDDDLRDRITPLAVAVAYFYRQRIGIDIFEFMI